MVRHKIIHTPSVSSKKAIRAIQDFYDAINVNTDRRRTFGGRRFFGMEKGGILSGKPLTPWAEARTPDPSWEGTFREEA